MPVTDAQIIQHLAHGALTADEEHDTQPGQPEKDTALFLGVSEARVRAVHRANREAVDALFESRNEYALTIISSTPNSHVSLAPPAYDVPITTAVFIPDIDFTIPPGYGLNLEGASPGYAHQVTWAFVGASLIGGEEYPGTVVVPSVAAGLNWTYKFTGAGSNGPNGRIILRR